MARVAEESQNRIANSLQQPIVTFSKRAKTEDSLYDPVHTAGPFTLTLAMGAFQIWLTVVNLRPQNRSNRTKVNGLTRLNVRDEPVFFPSPPPIIFRLTEDPNRTKAVCEILSVGLLRP